MFFIISKLFSFILIPSNWLLLLIIARWTARNRQLKKRLLIALLSIFFFFSNEVIFNEFEYHWQVNNTTIDSTKLYDAGIVLGGMNGFDKNKKGFFSESSDRFIQTIKLYHSKKIKKIIVSGGSGNLLQEEPREADFIVAEMINCGVQPADIFIENNSKNTFENAVKSKKILDSLQLKPPFILVTSANHLPRALLVFKKANLAVLPYPAAFRAFKKDYTFLDYILPNIIILSKWNSLLKEFVGIVIYQLLGKA